MRIFLLLAIFISAFTHSAYAQSLNYKDFSNLPVLHEGRVKPLDSFARVHLKKWTGSDNYKDKSPSEWLAMILFDPQVAMTEPFFQIRDKGVLDQLGLEEKTDKYYALQELLPSLSNTKDQMVALLQSDPNTHTPSQQAFLKLHENTAALSNMMRSFSMFLPLSVAMPERYADTFEENPDYLALSSIETPVKERLVEIVKDKGDDIEAYDAEEQKIAQLSFQLESIRIGGETNSLFKIMPGTWSQNADSQEWYAPWQLILSGQGSPQNAQYLQIWDDMAQSYRNGSVIEWNKSSTAAQEYVLKNNLYDPFLFKLEKLYNQTHPYDWARILYLAGIILIGISFVYSNPLSRIFAITAGSLAAIAHASGIVSRVLILERPPVGTLYESVLFVALICAIGGLIACICRRNDFIFLAGLLSALGLMLVAPILVPEGESLEVLVAVLNTNFWLATHVTIITAGYGVSIIAACMAHFYMVGRLSRDKKKPAVLKLYNATYRISILALLLTAVGTVLGGIWADQSWGRFWGWDPKENGALLIVLWLIWIQHGRLSGNMRDLAFMAAMGFLNVVVALAWFGVNLLGVGLHSYGFTSGIALGLGLFCAIEIILLAGLWITVRAREKRRVHAA